MQHTLESLRRALARLSPEEIEVLNASLLATCADRAVYEDWEFETLFGVTRDEMDWLVRHWKVIFVAGNPADHNRDKTVYRSDEQLIGVFLGTFAMMLFYPQWSTLAPKRERAKGVIDAILVDK